ncbi:hypothetical protein ACFQMM_06280 [Saliphagus sp. GCM10025308]
MGRFDEHILANGPLTKWEIVDVTGMPIDLVGSRSKIKRRWGSSSEPRRGGDSLATAPTSSSLFPSPARSRSPRTLVRVKISAHCLSGTDRLEGEPQLLASVRYRSIALSISNTQNASLPIASVVIPRLRYKSVNSEEIIPKIEHCIASAINRRFRSRRSVALITIIKHQLGKIDSDSRLFIYHYSRGMIDGGIGLEVEFVDGHVRHVPTPEQEVSDVE